MGKLRPPVSQEPPSHTVVNPEGRPEWVLLCDHASRHVPARLANLGLDEATLHRHIAWDIGAGAVAERVAALIDAPLVMAGFSRLVIDANRPLNDPTSIAKASDGVAIPGNAAIDAAEARARAEGYFWPYHRAVEAVFAGLEAKGATPALLPIHSFTPIMQGFERPWQIGILWDRDRRLSDPLLAYFNANPSLTVGDNQPYSGASPASYSLKEHGDHHGRPHASIEIRQDLIDTPAGVETWARLVADALRHIRLPGAAL
ncbi:MAG: N-formylglutamate amidohydrolase [Alphaproteobacteria bacterium]|nr:N-formylglutamate amidohydrolase [Alphaproteobacteria bacterium]